MLTTESFIEKARRVHGNRYNYSLVEYKGTKIKIKIICHIHGEFEQAPSNHLSGQGCVHCNSGRRRFTTEIFVEKARKVHGDKYDYSLVEYKHSCIKVKIICPVHGEFEQIPNVHLHVSGCAQCAHRLVRPINNNSSRRGRRCRTNGEFIEKAKKVHNGKYDYLLSEYENRNSKVRIICPIHGVFEQNAADHLRGSGCQKCSILKFFKHTKDEFIERANEIHNNKYDYSLVEYVDFKTKVKIICPIHGIFEQSPKVHLKAFYGCNRCAGVANNNGKIWFGNFRNFNFVKHNLSKIC